MNKNVKRIVIAGMVTSLLLSVSVRAEELGAVRIGPAQSPIVSEIGKHETSLSTSEIDEFLKELYGDSVETEEEKKYTPTYIEPSTEAETEKMVDDLEEEINKEVDEEKLNNADEKVISYFDAARERLKEYAQSEDYATLKREAKKVVTDGIDFLFYDGEIDGFTRKQLTEEGKKDVMNTIESTVSFLDEHFPGFTDSFGHKYTSVKLYLDEKFVGLLDRIRGWVGEDASEAFGQSSSNLYDEFGDSIDKFVGIIDGNYQEWKLKK